MYGFAPYIFGNLPEKGKTTAEEIARNEIDKGKLIEVLTEELQSLRAKRVFHKRN